MASPFQAALPTLDSLRPSSETTEPLSKTVPSTKKTMQTRSTPMSGPTTSSINLPALPRPPLKRHRSEALQCSTTMESSSKRARDVFFDLIIAGNSNSGDTAIARAIESPDDLEKPELLRCFELLHACGRATQPDATLATTRKSVEGFLDAIFNAWKAGGETTQELVKPELEVQVDAEILAGKVCTHKGEHKDVMACIASEGCKVDIAAVATYTTALPNLKLVLSKRDKPGADPTPICPLSYSDINWKPSSDLAKELRTVLEKKILSKVHKYNKHIAVWEARKMIRAWAKGEDHKEWYSGQWGFVGADQVKVALMGFGREAREALEVSQ